jgi:hypothetical protein
MHLHETHLFITKKSFDLLLLMKYMFEIPHVGYIIKNIMAHLCVREDICVLNLQVVHMITCR